MGSRPMGHRRGVAGLGGAVVLTLVLGLIAAPALAKATYKLAVNVPSHPKVGASYSATGLLYLNSGAEILGVFYDKDRCSNSYATELKHSESAGLFVSANLVIASVQGQFSEPFKMVKYAKKAHNLCDYLAHTIGNFKFHTDRVVKLRFSIR
jgi:hypothetical protein